MNDQSQEIQHLHDEIKNLRALSGEQQKTIQAMERILKVAGGKVSKLSLRLTTLRQTNDGLNRLASNEEQAIREMEKSVADVKVDLKEVRDEMAKAGFTP